MVAERAIKVDRPAPELLEALLQGGFEGCGGDALHRRSMPEENLGQNPISVNAGGGISVQESCRDSPDLSFPALPYMSFSAATIASRASGGTVITFYTCFICVNLRASMLARCMHIAS